MKSLPVCFGVALLIACTGLIACTSPGSGSGNDPDPLLPERFPNRWEKQGEPKRFTSAELYGYINGGAEVFLELGFERLIVQPYIAAAGEIIVEVYRMSDAPAALGVYLLHAGREVRVPELDVRHTANLYQIQFVKGKTYVKLNNPSGSSEAGSALPEVARSVAELLPDDPGIDLFARLPAAGRISGTERVIRGPFTLERICFLGKGDLLMQKGKVTALAADYCDDKGETFSRIVVEYPDQEAATAAFNHLAERVDPGLEIVHKAPADLIFKDFSNRFGKIETRGRLIELKVHLAEVSLSQQP